MSRRRAVGVVCLVALGLTAMAGWLVGAAGAMTLYESVSFADAQHGWLAGRDGDPVNYLATVLWSTTDGGVTWQEQQSRQAEGWGVSPLVGFSGRTTGIMCDFQGLYHSADGGLNWTTSRLDGHVLNPDSYQVPSADFANRAVGWMVADMLEAEGGGLIAKTTNGGATWRTQKRANPGQFLQGGFDMVSAPSALRCYVLGWEPIKQTGHIRQLLFATNDGGAHWTHHSLPSGQSYSAIAFPGLSTGWLIGSHGSVFATTDAGRTWRRQSTGVAVGLNAVAFTSVRRGQVGGENGVILGTDDGGRHWAREASNTDGTITDVTFVNALDGWALVGGDLQDGIDGSVLRTSDGGKSWGPRAPMAGSASPLRRAHTAGGVRSRRPR